MKRILSVFINRNNAVRIIVTALFAASVELYFADYRRQLFIRTGSLLIKITPDCIVENINLLRHQQIVNSQRQQKNKDDQKTHPVAI